MRVLARHDDGIRCARRSSASATWYQPTWTGLIPARRGSGCMRHWP